MRLYILRITHPDKTYPTDIYSTNEVALLDLGRSFHAAAESKPELSLINPDGGTVASMDEWSTDWVESAI